MKTCPQCASPNEVGAAFCATCGGNFSSAPPAAAQTILQETSGKAIASMCFGLLFLVFPAAIAAVILGHMSNSEIRKSGGRLKGGGMALAGMLLGYSGIALFPVVLVVIAALTISTLTKSRVNTNELSAVADLRTVNSAASVYFHRYNAYPPSLEALGPPPAGQSASAAAAGLLDASLSTGIRGGYVISYSPLSSHRHEGIDGFNADADPAYQGTTGQRHFHVDETGVIREQMSNAAGRNSPVLH